METKHPQKGLIPVVAKTSTLKCKVHQVLSATRGITTVTSMITSLLFRLE